MKENYKKINRLVELILEQYEPEMGLKHGYAIPIGKGASRGDTQKDTFVWQIEKLYELSVEELQKLIADLYEEGK